mgnify:CR=1 FL=1
MNKQDLINFENKIVEEYKKGLTLGPVHLSGGNESQLIQIFENIKENDGLRVFKEKIDTVFVDNGLIDRGNFLFDNQDYRIIELIGDFK